MIARCPECQTRYRLAREKIGPQGARIRCSRCQTIFGVKPPPAPQTDVTSAEEVPAASRAVVERKEWTALVAEADEDVAKAIAEYLASWKIEPEVVHSGGEAILRLHRKRPDVTILGGHLPGLSAPGIAEIVRRNPELRDLRLIRVAPIDEPVGVPEFEANHTLEPGDLCEGLTDPLRKLGVGERRVVPAPRAEPIPPPPVEPAPTPRAEPIPPPPVEPAPTPAVERVPPPPVEPVPTPPVEPTPPPAFKPAPTPSAEAVPKAPIRTPGAPPAAAPDPPSPVRRVAPTSDDPEIAKAERLARIIISDIILYNEEKFASAVASGDVAAALSAEVGEASQLFTQRIPEEVRASRDFLTEELERRAEQFSAQ